MKEYNLKVAFRVACAYAGTSMRQKTKDFGISSATLNLVLNGEGVSAPTTEKIINFIKEVRPELLDGIEGIE